jgi:tetratricopeptide (TPR) repeat protein
MAYLDQIGKYLNGELSSEERARFEKRLKANPRLAEDTRLYKELTGFLSKNVESVDKMINTVDEINHSVQHAEWNKPENAHWVDSIGKIIVYLGESIQADVYQWLRTEAIIYPELIDDILQDIDEERFDNGYLSGEECLSLYDNLMTAYRSFISINSVVDDYLFNKPMQDNASIKPSEKKSSHHTRIYQLPNVGIEPSNKRKGQKFIFSMAATLALLIAAGSILWLVPSGQPTNEQLYSDFYNPYTVSTVQRSASPGIPGDFYKGMGNFSRGEYMAAIGSFANIAKSDVNYVPACFFTGISEMETHNYISAVNKFKEVLNAVSSNLAADAQWNLALCYLKLGNIEQTRKVLTDVKSTNPFYRAKALELLNKLPE